MPQPYTGVEFDECGRAKSWPTPAIMKKLMHDRPWPVKTDFPTDAEYYQAYCAWHSTYERSLEEWVVTKLREWGYEPEVAGPGSCQYWRYRLKQHVVDGEFRMKENTFQTGTLLTFAGSSPLRICDLTDGGRLGGDLLEPDYRKYSAFAALEKTGHDGVQINDFAQVHDHGNVGHCAIGLCRNGLAKLIEVARSSTTHPADLWADLAQERVEVRAA